jgi:hypothetical protein
LTAWVQAEEKEPATPEERFEHYVALLTEVVGYADRAEPLRADTTRLMLPGDRKSVEPMAARSLHSRAAVLPWLAWWGGIIQRRIQAQARDQAHASHCADSLEQGEHRLRAVGDKDQGALRQPAENRCQTCLSCKIKIRMHPCPRATPSPNGPGQ